MFRTKFTRICVSSMICLLVLSQSGCGSFQGSLKGKAKINPPLSGIDVELEGEIAKISGDGPPVTVTFYDKDGNPIGTETVDPNNSEEVQIPPNAETFVATIANKKDRVNSGDSYFMAKIDTLNFSLGIVEAESPEYALEEYKASLNGNASPANSKTLSNVQLLPLDAELDEWDLTIAEYREIVGFQVYYNGKLLADTDDGQITYDPLVGGRVKCVFSRSNDGSKSSSIFGVSHYLGYIFDWILPYNYNSGEVIVVHQTIDGDEESTSFEYEI